MTSIQNDLGSVASLWRYPVKSLLGEELNAAEFDEIGLVGDRAYALVDTIDGKVATAKNPRRWPDLFALGATLSEATGTVSKVPPVRITLPDGSTVHSRQADIHQVLSKVVGREVILSASPKQGSRTAEEYWPDIDGLDYRNTVTEFGLPEGTFFDCASVHLLTTATLQRLQNVYPHGRFALRRFRPNIVVETVAGDDFVENAWIGRVLAIGDVVRLKITGPCGRCVMTTLAQGDLPQDTGILRTAVQQNRASVGVYASVLRGGKITQRDAVRLE